MLIKTGEIIICEFERNKFKYVSEKWEIFAYQPKLWILRAYQIQTTILNCMAHVFLPNGIITSKTLHTNRK